MHALVLVLHLQADVQCTCAHVHSAGPRFVYHFHRIQFVELETNLFVQNRNFWIQIAQAYVGQIFQKYVN